MKASDKNKKVKNHLSPYKKGNFKDGAISIPIGLLLYKGIFTEVKHREIRPFKSLKDAARITDRIINGIVAGSKEERYIDSFLYLVEYFPEAYIALKTKFDDKYVYANKNLTMLGNLLEINVVDGNANAIFNPDNNDDSPMNQTMANLYYASSQATKEMIIYQTEEHALDAEGERRIFYTTEIPIFHKESGVKPSGTINLCTPFSQLPCNPDYVPLEMEIKS